MNIHKLMEVMSKYNGQKKKFGELDCHTFIYELYEPDLLEKLRGKYKTLTGGIRAAKKNVGYTSLYKYLMSKEEYILIENPKMIQTGDIIISKEHEYDVYICVEYGKAFGVIYGDVFGLCNTVELNNHYIIRHNKGE